MGGKSEEGEKRLEYVSVSGIESMYCKCTNRKVLDAMPVGI
jgi:hypothetical protein